MWAKSTSFWLSVRAQRACTGCTWVATTDAWPVGLEPTERQDATESWSTRRVKLDDGNTVRYWETTRIKSARGRAARGGDQALPGAAEAVRCLPGQWVVALGGDRKS